MHIILGRFSKKVNYRSNGNASRPPQYYNLDVIISVGYRVKSQRGVEFRQWANSILKQYILKGYAINEKRLQALQKTVEIQTRMLADTLELEQKDVLTAVDQYTQALLLLDQYDHQSIEKPDGNTPLYRITYDDCRAMIREVRRLPLNWQQSIGHSIPEDLQ